MNNIFNLTQSALELPSLNAGIGGLIYEQIAPTRDVTGTNFPNGAMHMKFEASGTKWWLPNKSRMRIRATITKADGSVLRVRNDIAINMGVAACLFQNGSFLMKGKTISRVADFVPQVDAINKRLSHSKSWLDGVGKDLERWSPDFQDRQNDICSDGYISINDYQYNEPTAVLMIVTAGVVSHDFAAATTLAITAATKLATFVGAGTDLLVGPGSLQVGDIIVTATLAPYAAGERYIITNIITALTANVERQDAALADRAARAIDTFSIVRVQDNLNNKSSERGGIDIQWIPPMGIFGVSHAIPASTFELRLNPETTSSYRKKAVQSLLGDKVPGTDYNFVVTDLYLEACMVQGPAVENISYFMSLDNTRCQVENIVSNTGFQTKTFEVKPSSMALTVAFQVQDLVSTNNPDAVFKFPVVAAGVKQADSGELLLTRFVIQYNGTEKPSPDADVDYSKPLGFINSRYAEAALYSGSYFDPAPGESRQDWLDRGMYLYFPYPKDGSSEATQVTVKYNFSPGPAVGTANVLLFDHYKSMVLVNVVNGQTLEVLEQDG